MNRSDLTLSENFNNFLGSFWNDIFDRGNFANGIADYSSHQLAQLYKDLVYSVNSISVDTVPVYRREMVVPIVISQQEIEDNLSLPTYGSGLKYGEQDQISPSFGNAVSFGLPYIDKDLWFVDLPEKYILPDSNPIIVVDRLYNGSILWVNGINFHIRNGRIIFKENPFSISDFPKRLVKKNGKEDQEIVVWLCEVDHDARDIFRNFGSIFSRVTKSSEIYKKVCSKFFSIVSEGANVDNIDAFFSAAAGSPMIAEEEEMVLGVYNSPEGRFVETDKELYLIDKVQKLKNTVIPGAKLKKNFALTSVITVIDPKKNRNWWKDLDTIPASGAFADDNITFLSFKNEDTEVVFTKNNYGGSIGERTLARFNVIGNKKSIKTFWENVDKEVIKRNINMEETLPWSYKERQDGSVEKSINPADFFVNYVANSIILPIKIDLSQVADVPFLLGSLSSPIGKIKEILPVYSLVYVIASSFVEDSYDTSSIVESISSVAAQGNNLFHVNNISPVKSITSVNPSYYHTGSDTMDFGQKQFAIESILVKYRSKCSL